MASKMRSERPSRRSRTGRRPRPSWGQWTGVPLNDATQHAPPRDLRETMGIVPSGIAEWPLMQRQGASRGLTKRIHHPAEGRMAPVLVLDLARRLALKLAAAATYQE